MINFEFSCGFHYVERTDNITVEVSARVFEAVTHTRLRGEMYNHIRLEGFS